MVVGFPNPVQSVPITNKVVSLNPAYGEVNSIQHYVIKFVSDLRQRSSQIRLIPYLHHREADSPEVCRLLRQVCGFLWVLRFSLPIKLTATIITEILLKVASNTVILTLSPCNVYSYVKTAHGFLVNKSNNKTNTLFLT